MNSGGKTSVRRRAAIALMVLVLIAGACSASAPVTGQVVAPDVPTAVSAPETQGVEPTSVVQDPQAGAPTEVAPDPTTVPVPAGIPANFLGDAVHAISNDGIYAYAGTTSPWNNPTPCDSAAVESLAVVNIAQAAGGDVAPVGVGLEQVGDVRQVVVGEGSRAVVISACGPIEAASVSMQRIDLGADGRLAASGDVISFGLNENESDPYVLGWTNADTVEVRVVVEEDPDDAATWRVERRQISTIDGAVGAVEQFSYFDDEGFFGAAAVVSGDGQFTYREIEDPAGGLGCEGFGIARTIQVESGDATQLALGENGLVFSGVQDLHFSPDGYVSWSSGCEGFRSAYVGRTLPDGTITDAHLVETYQLAGQESSDFRVYRLTNDGFLAAAGQRYVPEDDTFEPAFLRYDLAADPGFVNTAEPPVAIDPTPLFAALNGTDSWHLGPTLAEEPACGAMTLYAKTAVGFARAFSAGVELDSIVDVDLSATRRIQYDDSPDFVSRTVVASTVCPGEHEGVRVWFGAEPENVNWGLSLARADVGEVAEVLSVRVQLDSDDNFVLGRFVEVRLLDGSTVELPLIDA